MENKNQNKFYADEESINAFVEKHVIKSQRAETVAILRSLNGKNLLDIFDEAFQKACEKEKTAM